MAFVVAIFDQILLLPMPLVRETVWLSRMHGESNYCYVRNEERFETDRLGFISWLDDVMEEKKELE